MHRMHRCILLAAVTLLTAAPMTTQAGTFVDDFEGGRNDASWAFIRTGDILEPNGGNPGWWLHQPSFDTFAPILECAYDHDTPFTGDYRAQNVTRISFDAQTLGMNYGDGSGFSMVLLLRNSRGTYNDIDDDDYAYFVGPNVPRVGEGWVHYDIDIPSQATDPVPPGWKGGWSWDCENFRPGVTWSDVMTSVNRVEIWWIDPCYSGIFQNWNVGVDNLTIQYETATPTRHVTWGTVKSMYRD